MNREIPPLSRKRRIDFYNKINKAPGYGPNRDCWKWIGGTSKGYGSFGVTHNGITKTYLSHRISYFLEYGKQPDEVCCHKCDNPSCVNPDHLFSGTQIENIQDRDQKNRGGGHKRRGKNNGKNTKPESTVRGKRWYQIHDKPEIKKKKSDAIKKFHQQHPEAVRGENNPRSKLTEIDIKEIRKLYPTGISAGKLSKMFGVSKQVILAIIHRRLWKHVV